MFSASDIQQTLVRLEVCANSLSNDSISDCKECLVRIGHYLIETEPNNIEDYCIQQITISLHVLKIRSIRSSWRTKDKFRRASAIAAGLVEIINTVAGQERPSKFFEDVTVLGELLEFLCTLNW